MSPYERQIDPLEAVDVNYVLGVPGQATSDETMEPLLSAPLSAQRLGTHDAASETLPTASELLAAAGIQVDGGPSSGLGYDPSLGYDTGSHAAGRYAATERDTELVALLEDSGNHSTLLLPPATGLDPRVGLGLGVTALALCLVPVLNVLAALLAVGALVVGAVALRRVADRRDAGARLAVVTVALAVCAALGSVVSMAAYGDSDGPSGGQLARANGTATSQVLAEDLGVGLGAYAPGGLPVTLTNTAHEALAYNVSVEALDAAGRRVTADLAFVGALAPGQSTVVTLFSGATGDLATELAGAQFHIVEASAY
jgi:hypothetical protein